MVQKVLLARVWPDHRAGDARAQAISPAPGEALGAGIGPQRGGTYFGGGNGAGAGADEGGTGRPSAVAASMISTRVPSGS